MKKIFLLFVFCQTLVFSNDNVIGTIIFEDRNYFVHDKNENKKAMKESKVITKKNAVKKPHKNNDTRKLIDKRNILKKRGVEFLVWADREDENKKVINTLLDFNSHELPKIQNYTIVASKDYTFTHSKTGFLFVSPNSDKKGLLKYLNKNTTKKRISSNRVHKRYAANKKQKKYKSSTVNNNKVNFNEKKVNLYKNNRSGFEYTLYK